MKLDETTLNTKGKLSIPSVSKYSTNRTSAFLTSIPTDDFAFVQTEIDKIDKDLFTREQHKRKIWDQAQKENVYFQHGKLNHRILTEIKHKVNGSKGIQSVDWSEPQNYIPKDRLETVFDSLQIQKYMNNKSICKERYIDLHTYKTQSKEVCLRNMLIDLMNEEKVQMEKEKILITNALGQSIKKLNEDVEIFDRFTKKQKKIHQDSEMLLAHLIKENKRLIEKKKKVTQEHRQLLDETEKNIRMILNLKFYAVFVHTILGGNSEILHCDLPDKLELKNRERDLIDNRAKIFKELGYLENDLTIESEIINEPSKIMYVYKEIENNILKLLDIKSENDEKRQRIINETENSQTDFISKIKLHQIEYDFLVQERDDMQVKVNEIKSMSNKDDFASSAIELIQEIGDLLKVDRYLLKKEKNESKYLETLYHEISAKDHLINNSILLLSTMEGNRIFDNITDKIRKENRIQKYYEEIKNQMVIEKDNKAKLDLKMNQIIFKGRGRNLGTILPPMNARSQKINRKKKPDDNRDLEMMTYY